MSSLFVDFESSEVKDFSVMAIEASHVDVHPARLHAHESFRPLTQLRNIVFGKTWYDDKVASCSCDDLKLYRVGDLGYTVCKEHGIQSINRLRKNTFATPGARKAAKAEARA
jgi:hypothetical protein